MLDIVEIDADLPAYRAAVKFRNADKPCLVIAADKATSDAKNFREAAAVLNRVSGPTAERAKQISAWLNDLADSFSLEA